MRVNLRITVWSLFAGVLFLISCGARTDIGLRFEMERQLVRADRLNDQFKVKGPALSESDLEALVKAYSEVDQMIARPKDASEIAGASQPRKEAWALATLAETRIGALYLDNKSYDKAFDYFRQVSDNPITTKSQRAVTLNYMAIAKERMKSYFEAAALYDSVAQVYRASMLPENPSLDALNAPLRAAEMYRKAGDVSRYSAKMEQTRTYYSQLMKEYANTPMESAALGKLAASYLQQGMYPEAIEAMKSAKPDSSGHLEPSLILMIADIYLNNLRDYSDAEKNYREFIAAYPNEKSLPNACLGLGLSLYQQKKYAEARKAVGGVEKITGVSQSAVAQGYYLTALCYDSEGKWDLAKGQFDLIQATLPGTDEAFETALFVPARYRSMGQSALAQNAFKSAVDYINKYVDMNAANQGLVSRALGYLVRAYTENGDYGKAAETLALLHQRFPKFPEGQLAPLRIADLNENVLHDTSAAITWLKTYADENPQEDNIADVKGHIAKLETLTKKK